MSVNYLVQGHEQPPKTRSILEGGEHDSNNEGEMPPLEQLLQM